MQNRLKKILLFISGSLLLAAAFSLTPSTSEKEINVWHKVSDNELDPGVIMPLDMSKGYSFCAGTVMFIVVSEIGSEDDIVIAFPNGGYWTSPKQDPFLEVLQDEFDSLEKFLEGKGGTEWKKD
jgi:hypothetical protein